MAVVLGGVGLYGMSARNSESGAQVLEDMRLQAILNTAGSGAVDAYVAAAKSEASTKARESGGGMSAVREAAGAAVPFDILPAVWLTSLLSVLAGLLAAKLFAHFWRN